MSVLPSNKAHLRDTLELMVLDFLEAGGSITYIRPGFARGASFTRNTSPRNRLIGIDRPSQYS